MSAAPTSSPRARIPRPLWIFLLLATLCPIVFTLGRSVAVSRNFAYLDDIDGALMLLLRLQDGWTWSELGQWMFEVANEHRMVTSRVMYAVGYWLTDTVDFRVMDAIGNAFLCALFVLLVRTAGTRERRWGMALLLAGLLFQLEHYENFFWAGSSIDHFQVPLLAGGVMVLLARGGAKSACAAAVLATLATFTLAHGLVLWPVGALVLWVDRRWKQLGLWAAIGAAAGVFFLTTFQFNSAHQVEVLTVRRVARTFSYWLELMGAPLALGVKPFAMVLGVALAAWLGVQLAAVGLRRERITLPLALWAVGSLALVAVGRANLGDGVLASRYYVLGALAWAMVILVEIERRRDEARPLRFAVWLVPALAVFNVAANVRFAEPARKWVTDREQAVVAFVQHGRDGTGRATLHPLPEHATRVLRQAEKVGVFEMPRQVAEKTFANPIPGAGFSSAVDRVAADEHLITIEGWAAVAHREAQPGDVHLVLASGNERRILTTQGVTRPDVAAAFPGERWREAGFRFQLRRWLLPPDSYQIGLLIPTARGPELVMTGRKLELSEGPLALEKDKIAPNRIVYDELVLRDRSTSVTAAPNKLVRVSFLDLHDNLVHVDFSGAGTLNVSLGESEPKSAQVSERGRRVTYLKGNASVTISGADESTNLAIFTARRSPAGPRATGSSGGRDGLAHLASVSIDSRNGRFGAVRTGNVFFSARSGLTGINAPGIRFAGPVNIGNISAYADAVPVFRLGFARETRIAGGDLVQPNGRPLDVSGVWRLRFVEGRTSGGELLPARLNGGQLFSGGRNVTAQIVAPRPGSAD